jgi:hypothetical protein
VESTNYGAPRYVIFPIFLLLYLPYIYIFSLVPYSQTSANSADYFFLHCDIMKMDIGVSKANAATKFDPEDYNSMFL